MEQKINALKTASRVISVITKIGYTAMIVMICICATLLIFITATGGELSKFTLGKTNVVIFDEMAATPTQTAAISAMLIAVGGISLAIFLLAYRMFHEISRTGEPFTRKYVKTVRVIGILIAAMPVVLGIVECIVSVVSKAEIPELYTEVPGIVVGAVIFCLSYIIDYGCELQKQSKAIIEETEQ